MVPCALLGDDVPARGANERDVKVVDARDPFLLSDPARTAVQYAEEKIDYARFSSDVADLAAWLADQSVAAGQRAGVFLRQPYWEWVAHLAAMRLGLTVATLTSRFYEEIESAGGIDIWLGESPGASKRPRVRRIVPFSPKSLLPLRQQLDLSKRALRNASRLTRGLPQRLMFTSGTTGTIKAVLWDADVLAKRVELARSSQGVNAGTNLMMLLGIDTTAGFRYPLAVWRSGGCVLMRPPIFGTEESVLSLKSLAATNFIVTSPQRLQDIVKAFWQPWPGREVRKIVVAGGRMPTVVRDTALRIACANISIAYGATETGSIATCDSAILDRHAGAVGFAVEGATVQVVDEKGDPKAPGEPGEIRTRTSYMAQRYEGSADSNGSFHDGWFHPGDEGILFADGLLVILGRLSETINLMGAKFATPDLEEKLARLPSIRDVAVVMLDAGTLGVAVVCDDKVNLGILEDRVREQIATGVPVALKRVPVIPRNAMGKVARIQLERQLSEALVRDAVATDTSRE